MYIQKSCIALFIGLEAWKGILQHTSVRAPSVSDCTGHFRVIWVEPFYYAGQLTQTHTIATPTREIRFCVGFVGRV